MEKCSFLSTHNNRVECFKECAFYSDKAKEEGCPFQNIKIKKPRVALKRVYHNYYIDEEMGYESEDELLNNSDEFLQYM